jgi:hypothetical protein
MKPTTGRIEGARREWVFRQGKVIRLSAICALPLLPATALTASAGEHAATSAAKPELSDLTFSSTFSTGWNEPWVKRPRGEGTPDMSLLRVQSNLLGQLFRADYAHQDKPGTSSIRTTDSLTGILEYALNRRLMLAVIGNYGWVDSRWSSDASGATGGAFVRLHLVETAASSLATTLKVVAPNHDLGEKDTTVSFSIAGWHDLAQLGLKRTGFYCHVQEETLAGPTKPGARRNDFTYDVSLAKTWTSPDSLFGNTTTFIEAYGKTDLDGKDSGHTVITLTPGVRATFAHRHIVMAGVEFPITNPRPFEQIVRLTYICNF